MALLEEPRGPIFTAVAQALAPGATNPMDLFELVAPAASRVLIREFEICQYSIAGDANAEMVGLVCYRNQDTAGSGGTALVSTGTSPGIYNVRQLMTAVGGETSAVPVAQSTVAVGNTVLASNTANVVTTPRCTGFNAMTGYRYYPGFRGERIILDFGMRFVIRITPALSKAALFNATLVFQEIGNADV